MRAAREHPDYYAHPRLMCTEAGNYEVFNPWVDLPTDATNQTPNPASERQNTKCPQCPNKKPFKTESALKSHLDSGYHARKNGGGGGTAKTTNDTAKPASGRQDLGCPQCPDKEPFKSVSALEMHVASKHQKKKQRKRKPKSTQGFKCPQCPAGKAFKTESALKSHLDSGCHKPGFQCPQCPAKEEFKTESALKSHLDSGCHKPGFQCPQCPAKKEFKTESALKSHLDSGCHKPGFRCPQCPAKKEFKTESALKSHLDSGCHKSDLKCPQCPTTREFKTESALKMHLGSGCHSRENGGGEGAAKTTNAEYPVPTTESGWTRSMEAETPTVPIEERPTGSFSETLQHPTRSLTPTPSFPYEEPTTEEIIKSIAAAIGDTPRVTFPTEMLETIDTTCQSTQFLILSPTREIALYIEARLSVRCAQMGITTYACVDGTNFIQDIVRLREGPHIVSGTVDRVLRVLRGGWLSLEYGGLLVLNRETEILEGEWTEEIAELYMLLGEDTKLARASAKVPVLV